MSTKFKKSDMIAIPIANFITGREIPVDVYIQLKENKFILLVKAGDKAQTMHLSSYKEKDVDFLYIRKEEYPMYVDQNISIAGIIISKSDLEITKKTGLLAQSVNTAFAQVESLGMSGHFLNQAKGITQSAISLVNAKTDLSLMLANLSEISPTLVNHCLAVSLISTMIAKALKWERKETLEKLALGALFHDIGKKELPSDILDKPRALLSQEEINMYETHPYRGLQLLQSIGICPDDVLSIVYEHHENSLGQGFPRRLRDLRINPLAKVVGLADTFCHLTIKGVNNPAPKEAGDALSHIQYIMGLPYNKAIFAALQKLVEEPEEEKKKKPAA